MSDARDNAAVSEMCWITVLVLAAFICVTQATAMLSMLVGRLGMAAAAPVSLVIALSVGIACARSAGGRGWRQGGPALLAMAIILAGTAFSAFYFDLSWDGQWYHQTGIYALARDWNALGDPLREFPGIEGTELWVRHYAKGPWYFAAAVFDATGNVEWGKSINVLALAASGLSVFAAALDCGLTRARALMVALVLAFNPVVMSELTTFLVDAVMAGFLLVTTAALFSYLRRPTPLLVWVVLLASAISINAKFTGLIFLCVIFAAGGVWCFWRRRERLVRYLGVMTIALFVGTCVLGYNPYVTNTIFRHQPFYPALGSAAFPSNDQLQHGIDKWETPTNLIPHNRVYRLLFATFGRPSNAPYPHRPNSAELMWPFTATPSDLYFYDYHETRVAGFGPWFSGFVIFATVLFFWTLRRRGPARGAMILVAASIVLSLLMNAVFWWPRYAPQLWLLPAVPAVFVLCGTARRWETIAAWTLLCGLLANALIVAGVHLGWETRSTLTLRGQLAQLAEGGQPVEVLFRNFVISGQGRMDAWHIHYIPTLKAIRGSKELMSVVEGYPRPIQYRVMTEAEAKTGSPSAMTATSRPSFSP
jgi:4-amino-4-deoxy-L-arabinose transferase-like glycosyltransferase